jgi:hypothetical protein
LEPDGPKGRLKSLRYAVLKGRSSTDLQTVSVKGRTLAMQSSPALKGRSSTNNWLIEAIFGTFYSRAKTWYCSNFPSGIS